MKPVHIALLLVSLFLFYLLYWATSPFPPWPTLRVFFPIFCLGNLGFSPRIRAVQQLKNVSAILTIVISLLLSVTMIFVPTDTRAPYEFYAYLSCSVIWAIIIILQPRNYNRPTRAGLAIFFLLVSAQFGVKAFHFKYNWTIVSDEMVTTALSILANLALASTLKSNNQKIWASVVLSFIPFSILAYFLET